MSSARRTQRQEWKDHLESISFFDNVAILVEDQQDVLAEYNRAVAAAGICVILLTVKFRPDTDSEAGPVLNYLHGAHVIENVLHNRGARGTGKSRDEVIERIAAHTHGVFKPLSARGPFMLSTEEIGIDDDTKFPSEDIFFECPAVIDIALSQVAAPVITRAEDTGLVTITCATTGAHIFYTTDNKRPGPAKTLYSAPFTPDSGLFLQARAFLPGYLASSIATLTIP